jgi:hypothetical protein
LLAVRRPGRITIILIIISYSIFSTISKIHYYYFPRGPLFRALCIKKAFSTK